MREDMKKVGRLGIFVSLCMTAWSAEVLNDQTPLQTVREAAKGHNSAAQAQLAARLLNGKARSPQASRLLQDAENEIRELEQQATIFFNQAQLQAIQDDENRTKTKALLAKHDQLKKQIDDKKEKLNDLRSVIEKAENKEALELIHASIAQTNTYAMVLMTWVLDNGIRGIEANLQQAFELKQAAARLGDEQGTTLLIIAYLEGLGTEKNIDEALRWGERLCKTGSPKGCLLLARILKDFGDHSKKDPQRAYSLARAVQLAYPNNNYFRKACSEVIQSARVDLSPEQLLAAETEADTMSGLLLTATFLPSVWSGDLEKVKVLLAATAGRDHVGIVEILLRKGASIDLTNSHGRTALSIAAREGSTNSVRLLLDKGANRQPRDQNGLNASDYASRNGHTGIVEMLKGVSH